MRKLKLRSFPVKVTAAVIAAMLFISALSNFLIYRFTLSSQFEQLRGKLMAIARTAALTVDTDALLSIPLNKDGINTPEYKGILGRLVQIKRVNPSVRYIYTMTKTETPGIWQFIVDPDPALYSDDGKRSESTSYPGDRYDASRFPAMLKAYERPSADEELSVDEWGMTLSGYAPIRDKTGKSVAMIGVDMMADKVFAIQKAVHRRAIFVLLFGIVLSILMGIFISRSITDPVEKLVEGTRHIADGNLHFRVDIKGSDEISELANSFNDMSKRLALSKKKLHNYFYNTVQSLARIMEARDSYTKGHSDRVAAYAELIAKKMGFPLEKVELIKETALIHDIGKLGIKESILNKKEKLTDAEWEIIHQHPVVGEEMLEPLLLDKEMLKIIRCHHERYDGKGYPDMLTGENTNVFAQIISVVDAYDAMLSPRAYRPPLGREKAKEELLKNKGTQFNPRLVDIFLEIVETADEK